MTDDELSFVLKREPFAEHSTKGAFIAVSVRELDDLVARMRRAESMAALAVVQSAKAGVGQKFGARLP